MTYTDTTGKQVSVVPPGHIDSLFIDHAQGLEVSLVLSLPSISLTHSLSLSLGLLGEILFTLIIAVFQSPDIC